MNKKLISFADVPLILLLLFIFIRPLYGSASGKPALIRVEHERGTEVLPLLPDRLIRIAGPLGTTEIEVREGRASIIGSPCPGKLCVRSGKARPGGPPVVCLPNRVAVSVTGNDGEPDAVLR